MVGSQIVIFFLLFFLNDSLFKYTSVPKCSSQPAGLTFGGWDE